MNGGGGGLSHSEVFTYSDFSILDLIPFGFEWRQYLSTFDFFKILWRFLSSFFI